MGERRLTTVEEGTPGRRAGPTVVWWCVVVDGPVSWGSGSVSASCDDGPPGPWPGVVQTRWPPPIRTPRPRQTMARSKTTPGRVCGAVCHPGSPRAAGMGPHACPSPPHNHPTCLLASARTQEGRRHEGRDQKEGDSHPALPVAFVGVNGGGAVMSASWVGWVGLALPRGVACVLDRRAGATTTRGRRQQRRERIPTPVRGRPAATQHMGAPCGGSVVPPIEASASVGFRLGGESTHAGQRAPPFEAAVEGQWPLGRGRAGGFRPPTPLLAARASTAPPNPNPSQRPANQRPPPVNAIEPGRKSTMDRPFVPAHRRQRRGGQA